MTAIHFTSALELAGLIKSKQVSPSEVIEQTAARIEAVNPTLNAFVSLRMEKALDEAKAMTERIASGEDPGPLAGVPVGVKDLEDVEGMVTSYGSIPYKDNAAPLDSVQVARLKAAGAIVVGKTNTPEFGFTAFTKNRLFGVTRNPWNTECTPGGSSGGSAAAVAGGMVPLATGSDAGGSIRIPASYSGCFGFKPSFGRIPFGPTPLLQMNQLWNLGPLARTVTDAALYLDCVSGYHPADPDSLPRSHQSFLKSLETIPTGLTIAFSPDFGFAPVQKEVAAHVEKAVQSFEKMGHRVDLWKGRFPEVGAAWNDLIMRDLYGQLHHDLDTHREGMGRPLIETLELARNLSVKDRVEAQKTKTAMNRLLWDLFDRFDILATPTTPTVAFAAKGPPPSEIDGHPITLLGSVAFTYPFNLSGHPAASVRAGITENQLPVGLQIIGPRHRDDLVLQMAHAYEQVRPWNDRWPEVG